MSEKKQGEFLVTARKWRPRNYSDVVGQEHITRTLKNSIKSGRIHHAYLFCGPRGVGKTTTARIHAITINAHTPDFEPDLESDFAKQVIDGSSLDVIEIDGASNNSVDDVRKLRENAKYPPVNGKYKVYIIDEVHMLSDSAFNALLKILEEPPSHLMFIFATTEPQKIPATILSRCQRFDFSRMEIEDITSQLSKIAKAENIKIDDESLQIIAVKGDGSMRDSQSIFDQAVAFCGDDINHKELADALNLIDEEFFFELSSAIQLGNLKSIFELSKKVVTRGYDLKECISGLLEHFRNILTVKIMDNTDLIVTSKKYKEKYSELAAKFEKSDILRYLDFISSTETELRHASMPRIKFETALVQLASMDKAKDIEELLSEIKKLQDPSNTENQVKKNSEPVEATAESPQEYKVERNISTRIKNPTPSKDWNIFLEEYATPESGFSVLKNVTPVSLDEHKIELKISDDFTADAVKRKETHLRSLVKEFFDDSVELDITYDVKKNTAGSVNREKHPLEKKIIENFKATEQR